MKLFDVMLNTRYQLIQGGNAEIKSLTIDSRRICRGGMFFCIKGLRIDGHSFVPDVVEQGAAAIVAQDDITVPPEVAVIRVEDTRAALAHASANFYNRPADEMTLVGVTGTNGKTSTTYIMESVLNAYGKRTGVIGTVEFRIGGEKLRIHTATSTTPDAIELQQILRRMRDAKADCVVMETTSHALTLRKTDSIRYKVGIFTNLTQDHLDFHGTMEEYRKAKAKLFGMCEYSVLNADDPNAEFMAKQTTGKVLTYGINNECDIKAENVQLNEDGCRFTINVDRVSEEFFIPVRGRFSVYNSLGVIGAALCLNIPVADIRRGLENFGGVPGRIQSVKNKFGFNVVVDYAHTPDGLQNIILSMREITRGKVITVFGCGGDRDRAKRPVMGNIAGSLSDYCVITSDNPRTEQPEAIIDEIEAGIKQTECAYEKLADRRLAIKRAVELAQTGDSVIIAGKGHENYQIFSDRTLHFDDREEAEDALALKWIGSQDRDGEDVSLREAASATDGEIIGIHSHADTIFRGVCTDTRKISAGSLFIALKGDNFDGHDFIEQAFAKGAAACVVERDIYGSQKTTHMPEGRILPEGEIRSDRKADGIVFGKHIVSAHPLLKVSSTDKALLDLAEAHRRKFNATPVVAITGSSGKTTTKDLIASVLSQKYNTLRTEGNLNNEIGLPLTVLRLNKEHECAVFEMGMNHFGEISRMSKSARPDICLITNIGMAHAGYLGGRAGVFKAKTEIFDYINPSGVAILNGDDDKLADFLPPFECGRLLFGFGLGNEVRGANFREHENGSCFDVHCDTHRPESCFEITVPLPGLHMAYNALAAVAVGLTLNLSVSQIRRGISEFVPSKNRMDRFDSPWGLGVHVINDSYNANPESMAAALDVLAANSAAGNTVCILGDMKELGEFSENEHRKLGRYAVEKGIDVIIFVGEACVDAYTSAREMKRENIFHFADKDALMPELRGILKSGVTVLLKGSRAMKLDEIADELRKPI